MTKKIGIKCITKEEAACVLDYADKEGMKWKTGCVAGEYFPPVPTIIYLDWLLKEITYKSSRFSPKSIEIITFQDFMEKKEIERIPFSTKREIVKEFLEELYNIMDCLGEQGCNNCIFYKQQSCTNILMCSLNHNHFINKIDKIVEIVRTGIREKPPMTKTEATEILQNKLSSVEDSEIDEEKRNMQNL